MIDELTVTAVQFAPAAGPGATDRNLRSIVSSIRAGDPGRARLLVFPELALSGFPVAGTVTTHCPTACDRALDTIARATAEAGAYAVIGFAERGPDSAVYNSAALYGPGGLVGVVRKRHLPGRERGWFTPGGPPPLFRTPIGGLAVVICYDAWFPEYVKPLATAGAEIIVNVNSIWAGGQGGGIGDPALKRRYWRHVPVARALDTQCFVVACNGSGSHDFGPGIGTWSRLGASRIIDPGGVILARAPADRPVALTATLREQRLRQTRDSISLLADTDPAAGAPATAPASRAGLPTTVTRRTDEP